jgi:LmbE family N-acetylglucosaminyl deacetylase
MSRTTTRRALAAAVTVTCCVALWQRPARAAWPGRPGGGGDDTYQFADGFGQSASVTLAATAGGVQLVFPPAPKATEVPGKPWDTALLGVRVTAQPGNPYVDLVVGQTRVRQHVDPGAHGLRWLNLTGLRPQLSAGATLELRPQGARIDVGPATVRLFASQPPLAGRILVLAPHPDDAEIAAFGLYAERNATIVTVTSGNAGDANYAAEYPDPVAQYRMKGYLRAVDSVTVPWQGGIPPQRCFNLGYFDARLEEMRAQPTAVVPEMYGPNTDTSVYRQANVGRLLPVAARANKWANLVEDLGAILRKLRPAVVVMPHPMLDDHADHQQVTVAAVEAMRRWKGQARFLLYTNHAAVNHYPYGPAGTPAPLPPWSGPPLPVQAIYAHPVAPELQRRKLYALESMHDLRLSPAEQQACASPGAVAKRPDYPRSATDYFRRAPRPEELFFAFDRAGLEALLQQYLKGP